MIHVMTLIMKLGCILKGHHLRDNGKGTHLKPGLSVHTHTIHPPLQKVEGRVASDEDLKLSDTLRYYVRDGSAAKDLLYRRLRCLANYEQANKNLDRARAKNKDVHAVSVKNGLLDYRFVGEDQLHWLPLRESRP